MGTSQSTKRAAKFSGAGNHTRGSNDAPSTTPMMRRQLSQYNVNRNVKEFSRFWSEGGSFRPKHTHGRRRSESVRRKSSSVRHNTIQSAEISRKPSRVSMPLPAAPYVPPSSPRIVYAKDVPYYHRPAPQRRSYAALTSWNESYDNEIIFDSNNVKEYDCDLEGQHAMRFLYETTIY